MEIGTFCWRLFTFKVLQSHIYSWWTGDGIMIISNVLSPFCVSTDIRIECVKNSFSIPQTDKTKSCPLCPYWSHSTMLRWLSSVPNLNKGKWGSQGGGTATIWLIWLLKAKGFQLDVTRGNKIATEYMSSILSCLRELWTLTERLP